MSLFKFGDCVKTSNNQKGIVQENQVINSNEVKVMLEGDDYSHVFSVDELEIDTEG